MKRASGKRAEGETVEVAVTGRNMPVSDALEKYVTGKMSKLDRYLDRVSEIHVILSMDNARQAERRYVTEAATTVWGHNLRAQSADADMYASVDMVVDKLHQQMTRLKERTRNHKGEIDPEILVAEPLDDDGDVPELGDPSERDDGIVRVKQFAMKPMFADEAIVELEDLGHAFYVFLNGETEQVSVVYRRSNGSYGLIEPAFE